MCMLSVALVFAQTTTSSSLIRLYVCTNSVRWNRAWPGTQQSLRSVFVCCVLAAVNVFARGFPHSFFFCFVLFCFSVYDLQPEKCSLKERKKYFGFWCVYVCVCVLAV
jgi:hypothetical protein